MVKTIGVCAVALLFTGCSFLDIPRARNYPVSDQQKARAVHHWDVLAEDVAGQVVKSLSTAGVGKQIFVESAKENSGFNQAFRNLLVTELVKKGLTVSTKPQGNTVVNFDTQVVQHRSPLEGLNYGDYRISAIGGGVIAAYALINGADSSLGLDAGVPFVVGPLSLAADISRNERLGNATGGPTKTEVLINSSLIHADRYIARNSTIYYIEEEETSLYHQKDTGKTWGVTAQ
jgi:hypothetical protein